MDTSSQSVPSPESESPAGEYVVIARRYRPQRFEELVGQEHVARALQQAISSDRVGHAYLFTGARGVGKTSAARILAKALNCTQGPTPSPCNECDVCRSVATGDDVDVLEIDGASNRGIDEIRQLRQNVAVRPSRARFKVYIIDEVHMLTKEAFNALLKTLEEPPEHVKFIFATTEPQKIPITILSRCQRFDFAGISSLAIQARLRQIAAAEGVEVEPEAVQILAARAAGSMRDSQSLLEQLLAVADRRITADDVNRLLGIAPAERLGELVRHLVERDAAAALAALDQALEQGVEVGQLLDQLVGYFRDVMATAVGCGPERLLYALPAQAGEVAEIARQLGLETILAIGQILDQAGARMRVTLHGRTLVEMAVVRICHLENLDELAALVAELRGGPAAPQGAGGGGAAKKNVEGLSLSEQLTAATVRAELAAQTSSSGESAGAVAVGPAAGATAAPVSHKNAAMRRADGPHLAEETTEAARTSEVAASPQSPVDRLAEPSAADVEETERSATGGSAENGADEKVSVLAQWQRALAGEQPERPVAAGPRLSRREQLAAVAEQPFVRRAMELFDVAPGQYRYTPPEGDAP